MRQRLTAAVALLATLALLVVGSTLYVLESRRIDRVIEASLTQEIGEFRALQSEYDPETRKPFASADRLLTCSCSGTFRTTTRRSMASTLRRSHLPG